MPDPRAVVIELSAVEREQLESWSRRRSSAQAPAEGSRDRVAAAEGLNSSEIARQITDAQVEEVIVKTLETTPKDAPHWSTRSMARQVGLTQSAVLRIWKAFGLQPHRQDA